MNADGAPQGAPGQPPVNNQNDVQPVEPYPYADEQVIGGDSVSIIQRRLLEAKYPPHPSAEILEITRVEAQDRFEVKVKRNIN
jgi:hypothetical protein